VRGPEGAAGVIAAGGGKTPHIIRISGLLHLSQGLGQKRRFDTQAEHAAGQHHLHNLVIAQQSQSDEAMIGEAIFGAGGQ